MKKEIEIQITAFTELKTLIKPRSFFTYKRRFKLQLCSITHYKENRSQIYNGVYYAD
jgi:hypothetical protein